MSMSVQVSFFLVGCVVELGSVLLGVIVVFCIFLFFAVCYAPCYQSLGNLCVRIIVIAAVD